MRKSPNILRERFNGVAEEMDLRQSIMWLNDDCLYSIFSHLSMRELMVMEKVCLRFQSAAEVIYKSKYFLDFHCSRHWNSVQELQEISDRLAPYTHSLMASSQAFLNPDDSLNHLLQNYVNLTQIHLFGFTIREPLLLSRTFENLREVYLESCHLTDEVLAECLQEATQLRTLKVTDNRFIQGEWLTRLQNIQEINLSGCEIISPPYLIEFLNRNVQLKSLDIVWCILINLSCFDVIVKRLKNLESLNIDCRYLDADPSVFHELGNLPKLKHLKIYCFNDFNINPLLSNLAKWDTIESLHVSVTRRAVALPFYFPSSFTKLKELKLFGCTQLDDENLVRMSSLKALQELYISYRAGITNDGFIRFFENCRSLRLLCIIIGQRITDDLINDIMEILHDRRTTLEIIAGASHLSSISNPKLKIKRDV